MLVHAKVLYRVKIVMTLKKAIICLSIIRRGLSSSSPSSDLLQPLVAVLVDDKGQTTRRGRSEDVRQQTLVESACTLVSEKEKRIVIEHIA